MQGAERGFELCRAHRDSSALAGFVVVGNRLSSATLGAQTPAQSIGGWGDGSHRPAPGLDRGKRGGASAVKSLGCYPSPHEKRAPARCARPPACTGRVRSPGHGASGKPPSAAVDEAWLLLERVIN
ncbi:hypothetical protein SZ55_1015 [Pseudomonas sp. FeS53a]|nr:hypothetical protein SZ55_1015 [Pseudomonas sp. FeS53a]